MQNAKKIKLKEYWKYNELISLKKDLILEVIEFSLTNGIKLHRNGVTFTIEYNKADIEKYFEIIESSDEKCVYYRIYERNGEYDYYFPQVGKIKKDEDINEFLDERAKRWYSESEKDEEEDFAYYVNGGEVFVRGEDIEEISQQEYQILNKYM